MFSTPSTGANQDGKGDLVDQDCYFSTKVIFSLSSLWSHGDSQYNRPVYTFHDILTLYLRQRSFKNKCSRRDSDFYCGWTNGGWWRPEWEGGALEALDCSAGQLATTRQPAFPKSFSISSCSSRDKYLLLLKYIGLPGLRTFVGGYILQSLSRWISFTISEAQSLVLT